MKTIKKVTNFISFSLLLSMHSNQMIYASQNSESSIEQNQQEIATPNLFENQPEQKEEIADQKATTETIAIDIQSDSIAPANQEINLPEQQVVATEEQPANSNIQLAVADTQSIEPEKPIIEENNQTTVALPINETTPESHTRPDTISQNSQTTAAENQSKTEENMVVEKSENQSESQTTNIVKVYPVFDAAYAGIEKIKIAAQSIFDYVYTFISQKK
jgi:hypothetical protein